MSLKQLLREPLLHFFMAAGILFLLNDLRGQPPAPLQDDKTIIVDEAGLLDYLQYRSNAFETEYFTRELAAMSLEDLRSLTDLHIEEEILYREGKALGLEQGDYYIRQRVVQSMRFLIDNIAEGKDTPTDEVLSSYLQQHQDIYTLEPSVTFTHVFVDAALHGDTAARAMAEQLGDELNARGAGFNDAPQYGDRFPFFENYVERTPDFVVSHFGAEFAAAIAALSQSEKQWHGPVKSQYGYHLVMLTARTEARLPELNEIRAQVAEDWQRDRMQTVRSAGLNHLSSEYTIVRRDLGEHNSR